MWKPFFGLYEADMAPTGDANNIFVLLYFWLCIAMTSQVGCPDICVYLFEHITLVVAYIYNLLRASMFTMEKRYEYVEDFEHEEMDYERRSGHDICSIVCSM